MGEKIFKNLDEQIEILKGKGLIITDIEKTKEVLLRENYFFISGYRHLLMKNYKDVKFIEGTKFEELHAIFLFDRELRNIMFKNILVIENNVKSIISYQLSKKYGFKESNYLNPKNFNQDKLKERQVFDVISKMKRQIRVNGKKHAATLHYISNYGYIPMWILVKVLSFGIISELFSILKYEDQNSIASAYKVDPETLTIYLALLANFRNLCAHEDVLYDHKTGRDIPNTIYHQNLKIEQNEDGYIYGKNDLFALIIIMKEMLTPNEFTDLINELEYSIGLLDSRVDVVPINKILNNIGFPDNWKDIKEL
ncbi:MAG: Abi family protein [Bacilli bacterium]|nr:Abi family protein [Bacilli bacterium]